MLLKQACYKTNVVKTFINRNIPILDKLAARRDVKYIYTQGQKTKHTIYILQIYITYQ